MPKRGISRFSIENLLSHSTEKFRRGDLLCFTKFLVSKNFMDKRGGEGGREYHDFMSKFLSHSTEKFRRGTLVSENFWYRKMLGLRKGAGIRIFRQNSFVSAPNHFVEEPFCVSESFTYRKILCLRGEYHDFLKKICCLTVPKNFVEEPFCFSEHFWYRKMLGLREGAGITLFRQNSFVSQCRKTS